MDNTSTGGQPDAGGLRPGDTISPATVPVVLPSPVVVAPAPVAPNPVVAPQPVAPPVVAAQPSAVAQSASQPLPQPAPAPILPVTTPLPAPQPTPSVLPPTQSPSVEPESSFMPQPASDDAGAPIRWVATEFIAHHKSAAWYLKLTAAIIVLAAIIFLLTKDKISTSVVVVAGIALGAYGARQPQQRQYTLDDDGLTVGDKYLPFSLFRSFAVMDEGQTSSISFFPLKRFSQLTNIYYDPADEEAIVGLLADRLPMDDRDHDALDRFMHRIHF